MEYLKILPSYEGKNNVVVYKTPNGFFYSTVPIGFFEWTKNCGEIQYDVYNKDNKHALFGFDTRNRIVCKFFLLKKLRDKEKDWIIGNLKQLIAFWGFNSLLRKWIPCVTIPSSSEYIQKLHYGFGRWTILYNNKWSVEDKDNNVIVPAGKYDFIDCFDECGLARVKRDRRISLIDPSLSKEVRWGIINAKGEEVLEVKYSQIWNFCNKKRKTTKVFEKYWYKFDGEYDYEVEEYEFNLYSLKLRRIEQEYESNYGDYSVLDALDGCEDAAWNIDAEEWI